MPEAILYTTRKPDNAGGPLQDLRTLGSRSLPEALWCVHGKPDRAGGPAIRYSVRYMEAGPCRRPSCIQLGSPTMREDHYRIYIHLEAGVGRDWKSGILSQGIEGPAPHSLPSERRGDSEDRERACRILGSLQSWHLRDWKSGILSQGIEGSAPHSLPSERMG